MISEEVSLTLCASTNCRCVLMALRSGSADLVESDDFDVALAPVEVPVADTTPAFTNALKRLAMSGTGGAAEVGGTEEDWDDDKRRERSIDSALGCSNGA